MTIKRLPRVLALSIVVLVFATAQPAGAAHNDNYLGGQILVPASGATSHNNIGATVEPGEPTSDGQITATVWYHWVATKTGVVTFNTCTSDFDTTLAAYRGTTLNALTLWAFDDDGCGLGSLGSRISFQALAGITYHIQVGGYDGSGHPYKPPFPVPQGNYTLRWNMSYGLV